MANKKINAETVKNVLNIDYFGSNREPRDLDPIESTPMKLSIDQIDPYDRNPRRSRNPEYEAIADSLRANGQEEALTITRRPGSEKFMIKRGGNTRLEIMNTLYNEAGDERFAVIECLFMPWTNESDCIVGHLNENTTQGVMTLIDKARGYREFKNIYEQENEVELGQRKLAALLKEKGAKVGSKSFLTIMNFALDTLEPAIPETLARGLGKPQVEKLRRLNQIFQRLAEAHHLYEDATRDAQITAEFHHLLSVHDGDDWDLGLVQYEFKHRLIDLFDTVDSRRLEFDIEQCLQTDPWKIELLSSEPVEAAVTTGDLEGAEQGAVSSPESRLKRLQQSFSQNPQPPNRDTASASTLGNTEPEQAIVDQGEKEQLADSGLTTEGRSAISRPRLTDDIVGTKGFDSLKQASGVVLPEIAFSAGEFDIKSMRSRVFVLASQFAKYVGIPNNVLTWSYGYGFFLEAPKRNFGDLMHDEQANLSGEYQQFIIRFNKDRTAAERSYGWWMLWNILGVLDFEGEQPLRGFSKMPDTQMRIYLEQIYNPENTNIYKLGYTCAGQLRLHLGGIKHPCDMAMASSYIKPKHMMKYVELLEARTQLMAYVEEHHIDLWED